MSRGVGKTQQEILDALARDPQRAWSRMALQQAVWGAMPGKRPDLLKCSSQGGRPYKNVSWWKDGIERREGNFTRALASLAKRGLVRVKKRESGHMTRIMLSPPPVFVPYSSGDFLDIPEARAEYLAAAAADPDPRILGMAKASIKRARLRRRN